MQSDGEVIAPIVQVWAKKPANGGMLENATVRRIGDRSFIVGKLAPRGDGSDDERVGLEYWFPMDNVYLLTTYPSLEVAREVDRKYKESKQAAAAPPKRKGLFG